MNIQVQKLYFLIHHCLSNHSCIASLVVCFLYCIFSRHDSSHKDLSSLGDAEKKQKVTIKFVYLIHYKALLAC